MMKRDDYIQAIASGLLALSGETAEKAQAFFERRFELHEPRKVNILSLGGRGPAGEELGLAEWLRALREERPREVRLYWAEELADEKLPPHILAAFAGAQVQHFQVVTATSARSYRLITLNGPQQALGPKGFVELMDAQERAAVMWERVRELVHESNQMNNRPAVAPGGAAAFLLGREGAEVYDYLAIDLLREVQIECALRKTPFRIPPHLQDTLVQYELPSLFAVPEGAEPEEPLEVPPEDASPEVLEELRARVRRRMRDARWHLRDNPNPWQLCFFEHVPGARPPESGVGFAEARARFIKALLATEVFAERQGSPFAEAFRLGRALLEGDLPAGEFNSEHCQRIEEALTARGFSERAVENLRNILGFTEDLRVLHWSRERILGFLTVGISDVFGGMGSWNDIPVDDDAEYQALSSALYRAMIDFAGTVLSWSRE